MTSAGRTEADPTSRGAERQTLLVLGASGDLTARLLLPGLGQMLTTGARETDVALIGSAGADWDDERWRAVVVDAFDAGGADGAAATAVARNARYLQADATREDDLRRLLQACRGRVVIYFALPPAVTAQACAVLARIGPPPGTRLVLEKPFGTDACSARELNDVLAQMVPEEQIYRVDHILGSSTVLNVIGLRFANRIVEPVLNATHVASVDIVADETLALEGRSGYYDTAGALVDMIQSHLLQILALLTMEAPPSLNALEFRERKAQALRATRVWDDDPAKYSRRARYTAGEVAGRALPAYADEAGVDPARQTETLAEVVLAVDTWRWAGVPFRLRSGKALTGDLREAVVTFRQPPRIPDGLTGHARPDRLVIGFSPDWLGLDLNINAPGDPAVLDEVTLAGDFAPGRLSPYGEVLLGVFDGDPTLSVRGDTAEQSWHIVEPVLQAWRAGDVPLQEYPAGSAGPEDSLLPRRFPHR
jgi:glucose-6-phosphate 1-dehydrogenase